MPPGKRAGWAGVVVPVLLLGRAQTGGSLSMNRSNRIQRPGLPETFSNSPHAVYERDFLSDNGRIPSPRGSKGSDHHGTPTHPR